MIVFPYNKISNNINISFDEYLLRIAEFVEITKGGNFWFKNIIKYNTRHYLAKVDEKKQEIYISPKMYLLNFTFIKVRVKYINNKIEYLFGIPILNSIYLFIFLSICIYFARIELLMIWKWYFNSIYLFPIIIYGIMVFIYFQNKKKILRKVINKIHVE